MKKLFFLIPALALTLLANAAVINITPTSYESTPLNQAVGDAASNDTLVLAAGTYTETSAAGYIEFNKNLVVKAADNAEVIIDLRVPMTISGGVKAKIMGVKFDATHLYQASWYTHMIYSADASENNRLIFEGCDFYNDTINSSAIYCASNKKLDSLIINNCYFHNIHKSCIFLENTDLVGAEILNSTFANITTASKYDAGVIDIRTAAGRIDVDHCTFYNCRAKNTDYGTVMAKTSPNIAVSNCVFSMPESYSGRAIWISDNGGKVDNCIVYLHTGSSNGIRSASAIIKNNCIFVDPQFTDAANDDFSFINNNWETMSLSPACGAATDGIDLGDPRWHTAGTMPSTDFASAYNLIGTKAVLSGNISLNANENMQYNGSSVPGIATWKINVTKAIAVQAVVDMEAESASGCTLKLMVFDTKGNKVDSVVAPYSDKDVDINISGTLYFPQAGNYSIRLYNETGWSSAKVEKIILSYAGGEVQNIPGTLLANEAWYHVGGTRAEGKISYSSWNSENSWVKWNAATTENVFCNVSLRISTTNPHRFYVSIYEERKEEALVTLKEEYSSTTGEALDIDFGKIYLAKDKNYVIKVTNPVGGSAAKVVSLTFTEIAIPTINLPGTLLPADAMLSERAWVENDSLLFTARGDEGYNSSQWAKWKINAASHGYYKFTLNAYTGTPAKAQQYILTILSNDESEEIASVTSTWNNTANEHTAYVFAELTPGDYIVKVQNPEWGSTGRVLNIAATREGGAFIELPGQLLGNEAMLHATKLTRDENNDIQYNDNGTPLNEYVMWNIHVTDPDEMVVSFNTIEGGHQFSMELYKAGVRLDSIGEPAAKWETNVELSSHLTFQEAGNYQLKLLNNQKHSGGLLHSITFAPYVAPEPIVIDENATINGNWASCSSDETIDLSIIRTFKGGMYNTICLPFELGSENSMKAAFGEGYELLKLDKATLNGNELDLIFETKKTLEYGVPYLIKPAQDVVNPSFVGRKIKTTTIPVYTRGVVDFIGSFVKYTIDESAQNLYLGLEDKLYFVEDDVTMKGMRAYFRINNSNNAPIRGARIVVDEQVATEISLVNEDPKTNSQKLFIDGQLVIIRDGVQYNAQGQLIRK